VTQIRKDMVLGNGVRLSDLEEFGFCVCLEEFEGSDHLYVRSRTEWNRKHCLFLRRAGFKYAHYNIAEGYRAGWAYKLNCDE